MLSSVEDNVLITGLGAVACAGPSAGTIWESVLSGRSGIGRIAQWDSSGWAFPLGGEIAGFDPRALVPDRKLHKLLSRADLLGLNAAGQALADSGLPAWREGLDESGRRELNERTAVVCSSGGENYRNQYDYFPLLDKARGDLNAFGAELTSTVNPMWLLRTLPNNVLCYTGVTAGFKGPNANFTSHSAGGALAIIEAARMLRDGEADRALVVGYDATVEPQSVLYFAGLGLLSATAIRPFDAERDGSILGEGAAALLLETRAAAEERGAVARGGVLGGAVVSEAGGLLSLRDDGDGVRRAVREGLRLSGVDPEEVSLVAAHGNGTPRSDATEGLALLELFGEGGPPVTAFKWAVGHLIAASGVLEAVLTVLALGRREAPGIATLRALDPALRGLRVSREAQPIGGDTGILIGRGFGGLAASLVLRARCLTHSRTR